MNKSVKFVPLEFKGKVYISDDVGHQPLGLQLLLQTYRDGDLTLEQTLDSILHFTEEGEKVPCCGHACCCNRKP